MAQGRDKRPNILFCISDDQTWVHTGIEGDPVVRTPTFDRIAREGVYFSHTYCASPSCTPSRGSVLTGQMFWRLEEGGNLWSTLPAHFPVYPDILEAAGYHVGFTRKGWGPGQVEPGGRTRNAAGPGFKSFEQFMQARPEGQPFCFWFGSHEPHRPYKKGSGVASGMSIDDVRVPPFLPDSPEVRSDICDYLLEVQQYDDDVGAMVKLLEDAGELNNTIVLVTSDNGMPFPRAKANLYDYGTRMPLAVRWPARATGDRVVDDFISFTDFAPTFLEAAGIKPPDEMTGRSFLGVLESGQSGLVDPERDNVFTGRERHTIRREGEVGYPMRAIRRHDFLYIRNPKPDRWPAGDPEDYGDIDGGPTKTYMMEHRDDPDVAPLFELAFGMRPEEELYDLAEGPDQMDNVAGAARYAQVQRQLRDELRRHMADTLDPRSVGKGDFFDGTEYYGRKP